MKLSLEELKLISRALNFYSTAIEDEMTGESEEAAKLAGRIYRENFKI